MKPQKLKLEVGKLYIIDVKFHNGGKVKLVSAGEHFAVVKDLETGHTWTTMRDRLTEIK